MGIGPRITSPLGTHRDPSLWTASIVETSLKWLINLWETRNQDVHGHTETEQNPRLKAKHQITARYLLEQKHLVRPSDQWIFPSNPEEFLATLTAAQLGSSLIASRRKTSIKHSRRIEEKESSCSTDNITNFFPPDDPYSVARVRKWQQDRLIHDAYCKKQRHKHRPTSRSAQRPITGYLSLHGQLN